MNSINAPSLIGIFQVGWVIPSFPAKLDKKENHEEGQGGDDKQEEESPQPFFPQERLKAQNARAHL
jgi:hypothetical protein